MCYMTDVKDQNIMRPVKGRPDWYGTWHLVSRGCMSYEERGACRGYRGSTYDGLRWRGAWRRR